MNRLLRVLMVVSLAVLTVAASAPPLLAANLGLRILACSDDSVLANARIDYTVYHNNAPSLTTTLYTDSQGEAVKFLTVVCQDRVQVKVRPAGSGNWYYYDYRYEGGCSFDEWIELDVGSECPSDAGDGSPVDWILRVGP